MDGANAGADSSALPMCSYCQAAPAISNTMSTPLCIRCRLWEFAEWREAIDQGRRAADDELRRRRQARAAEAEYQRIMASAKPSSSEGLPRDLPTNLECLKARQQTLDSFPRVTGLESFSDEHLLPMWEMENTAIDVATLRREGWSEQGIEVWRYPYRYDVRVMLGRRSASGRDVSGLRDRLAQGSSAAPSRYDPQPIAGSDGSDDRVGEETPSAAFSPRDLPSDAERREARHHVLDEFPPITSLNRRTDDLLDKLWEFWNDGTDVDELVRNGWSPLGIDVWQHPYRYDIEQAFATDPERLQAIRSRNEPPVGDEYVDVPLSDQDAAAWVAERRWIAKNPDLWEARHERSKLGEALLDRDREARLEAAGFIFERALLRDEAERLKKRSGRPSRSPGPNTGRRVGSGAFESRDHFISVIRSAVVALRSQGKSPTKSAVSGWLDAEDGMPKASARTLQAQSRTWGFRTWDEVLAEVSRSDDRK